MTVSLHDSLPDALREVRTKPLFVMHLDVRPLQIIGATPSANRRIGVVPSGVFEGERLSGLVLDGGNDWQNVRSDGSITLDVRLVLKTADDALISMTYRGIRQGASDVIARVEKAEPVDPGEYYFRIAPLFETASPPICLAQQRRHHWHRPSSRRRPSITFSRFCDFGGRGPGAKVFLRKVEIHRRGCR